MLTIDNEPIKPYRDRIEFSIYIEKYAIENGVGIITSLLQYCEDADVDIKDVVKYMSDSLKEKLEEEAIQENYMIRKTKTVSFFE